jgi:hypothetical protein
VADGTHAVRAGVRGLRENAGERSPPIRSRTGHIIRIERLERPPERPQDLGPARERGWQLAREADERADVVQELEDLDVEQAKLETVQAIERVSARVWIFVV